MPPQLRENPLQTGAQRRRWDLRMRPLGSVLRARKLPGQELDALGDRDLAAGHSQGQLHRTIDSARDSLRYGAMVFPAVESSAATAGSSRINLLPTPSVLST